MRKSILLLLLLLFISGCGKESEPDILTFKYITEHPEKYAEVSETSFNNLIEINGTVTKVVEEKPSQELIDRMIEDGADQYMDVYASSYDIYIDDCDTPLSTRQDLNLLVNHKYTLVINVTKVAGKYTYNLLKATY